MLQHVDNTSMYLLDRDSLWDTLKPYELKFDPPPGFPKSNAVPRKNKGIAVEDIRGREAEFSIEKNGFAIMNLDAHVTVQDFVRCDGEELAKQYFKPLAETLKSFLRADRIQIIDFKVTSLLFDTLLLSLTYARGRSVKAIPSFPSLQERSTNSHSPQLFFMLVGSKACSIERGIY